MHHGGSKNNVTHGASFHTSVQKLVRFGVLGQLTRTKDKAVGYDRLAVEWSGCWSVLGEDGFEERHGFSYGWRIDKFLWMGKGSR